MNESAHPPTENAPPHGYWLWQRLKATLAWLKRVITAALVAGSLYIGLAQLAPVRAETYTVTDPNDAGDFATPGTLCNAIYQANTHPGPDTIQLSTNVTTTGVMKCLINSDITLQGNAYTLSGGDSFRPLFVLSGTVTLRNLTVTDGFAKGGNSDEGGSGAGLGGALFVYDGNVTLENVTLRDNAAQGGGGSDRLEGGGGMFGNGARGGGGLFASSSGLAGGYGGDGHYGGFGGSDDGDNGGFGGGGGYGHAQGGFGGFGGGGGGSSFIQGSGGDGGFGGGGGDGHQSGGDGGFGGGGGDGLIQRGDGGFGGGDGAYRDGGGGAGFGGALFAQRGTLALHNVSFVGNTATGDTGGNPGWGKGGALFICDYGSGAGQISHTTASTCAATVSTGSCGVTFTNNTADDNQGSSTDNAHLFGLLPTNVADPCQPELALTKRVSPTTDAHYHGIITYTIQLHNTGPSDPAVIFSDTLPTEVDFAAWVISPTNTSLLDKQISWNGSVEEQASLTWMYTARHTGNYGDGIFSTAYFSGTIQRGSADAYFIVEPDIIPPLTAPDIYTAPVNTSLSISPGAGVLTNDSDPNGQLLSANLVAPPSHGDVGLNADGSFVYAPTTDYIGTDTFTYAADDGTLTTTAQVTLHVTSVNLSPIAWPDIYVTREDTAVVEGTPGVLHNDADANGDTLFALLQHDINTGTLALATSGAFTYTPPADFNDVVTFTYVVSDSQQADTATAYILVQAVNDAPVANDDTYTTGYATALIINNTHGVLHNDTDIDGNVLTSIVAHGPSHGTLALNLDGAFTYTPTTGFSGSDSFSYIANDGATSPNGTLTDTATVVINISLAPSFTLTLAVTGTGTGVLSPTVGGHVCTMGEVLTLTATPNTGDYFAGWTGALMSADNPVSVVMDSNKVVTATFSPVSTVPTYTLTTLISPTLGGTVTLNPSGGVYPEDTIVTLTAIPTQDYAFTRWGGDLTATMNPTTLTMTRNIAVTASFEPDKASVVYLPLVIKNQ